MEQPLNTANVASLNRIEGKLIDIGKSKAPLESDTNTSTSSRGVPSKDAPAAALTSTITTIAPLGATNQITNVSRSPPKNVVGSKSPPRQPPPFLVSASPPKSIPKFLKPETVSAQPQGEARKPAIQIQNQYVQQPPAPAPAPALQKRLTEDNMEAILDPQIYSTVYPEVDFIFDRRRDLVAKPYHQDGNPSHYSKAKIAMREALKNEKVVKHSIKNFLTLYKFDEEDFLTKEEYMKVHTKISNHLRPDLKGEDAARVWEADWIRDAKGEKKIFKDYFTDSIFELADVWTPDIKAEQYSNLLINVMSVESPGSLSY